MISDDESEFGEENVDSGSVSITRMSAIPEGYTSGKDRGLAWHFVENR